MLSLLPDALNGGIILLEMVRFYIHQKVKQWVHVVQHYLDRLDSRNHYLVDFGMDQLDLGQVMDYSSIKFTQASV